MLFTHSAARQGRETPFTGEKACLSVRCCPQRQSEDVAVSVCGGKALPGGNCPWQWAADASVCHSAFVSSSPSFTSSPSLPLLAAPTKGKSSFTLLLSPVAAMATLCFVAEIYRKKITSDSLAVQSRVCLGGALESQALRFKAGLMETQCSFWERRSVSTLGGW